MPKKLLMLCTTMPLALAVLMGMPATAAADGCSGVLHRDAGDLVLGGGKGEGEGICIIAASQASKVLAVCTVGRRCRLVGKTAQCKDSGECVTITHITSVTPR